MTTKQSTEILIMFRSNHVRRSQFIPLRLVNTIRMHKIQAVLLWLCAFVATADWAASEMRGVLENVVFMAVMLTVLLCLAWVQIRGGYGTFQR
jgi:hypothetical protein